MHFKNRSTVIDRTINWSLALLKKNSNMTDKSGSVISPLDLLQFERLPNGKTT